MAEKPTVCNLHWSRASQNAFLQHRPYEQEYRLPVAMLTLLRHFEQGYSAPGLLH